MSTKLTVGLAQIAPVWMDREATLAKVLDHVDEAARAGCQLVAFGETLVPGYPFWLAETGGARFDDPLQKAMHAHYLEQAVRIEDGHLEGVCARARRHGIVVVLGVAERPPTRGGHGVFASRVYVDATGTIASVHRKLMPTHEERLCWAQGDGAGLVTHALGPFRVGALNCWENWMPLARTALYEAGETLHVALWPGSRRNTRDVTRFLALEGRSFVVSVSGMLRHDAIDARLPVGEAMRASEVEVFADGGSCVAGPDGAWLLEPVVGSEGVFPVELDARRVLEERQNFDPTGHYARPDVLRLSVDRRRP